MARAVGDGAGAPAADYVVVGAGSAGCVLANRLSADAGTRVLLLEAGGSDASWRIRMPGAMAYPLAGDRFVWSFQTEPEPGLGGRRIGQPRGRVLGGTSSINGLMFVRGHPLDFDGWAAAGCAGWGHAEILPYFRRLEAWTGPPHPFRGRTGPMAVRPGRNAGPLTRAFLEACRQAGYAETADINGPRQEGFGLMAQTIRDGRRESTAAAYLRPASARPNLEVATGAIVHGVRFSGRRAVGVSYRRLGREVTAGARREVVLAAGALGSPHLLLLSGVGPAAELRRHGIEVRADRAGVGLNLHDHPHIVVRHFCPFPVSLHRHTRPAAKLAAGLRWLATGTGPGATNHFEVGAFLRSRAGVRRPDLQLSLLALALAPGAVQSDRSIGRDGFQVHVDLVRPASRGRLRLKSADPRDPPSIGIGYLADPADREALRRGLRLTREILAQPALDRYRGEEVTPGASVDDDAAIDAWLTGHADTAYHPVGTCRMGDGGDPFAVVDPGCRVLGVESLRVVDASVMPTIVSGNTNAATVMIAEKAADMIAGRPAPPAEPAPFDEDPRWRDRQRQAEPGAPAP